MVSQITPIPREPLTSRLHLFRAVLVTGCHSTYWEGGYVPLDDPNYTLSYSFC